MRVKTISILNVVTNDQTIKHSYCSKSDQVFHCGFKFKSAC